MRGTTWCHTAALVAAVSAASCVCSDRKASGWDGTPPPEDRRVASTSTRLERPDLPHGWTWDGRAFPTGDPGTSLVTLERYSPVTVAVGSDYEYKMRVRNIARGVTLTDVAVSDLLPADTFELATSEPPGERTGDAITWRIGRLAPGESRDIIVRGKATKAGSLRGGASVSYAEQVGTESLAVVPVQQDTVAEFAPDPDSTTILVLDVESNEETVAIDGTTTYTITVTNNGANAAEDVAIGCLLPGNVEYVLAEGASSANRDGTRLWFQPIRTLEPGESAKWSVTVRALRVGEARLGASALTRGVRLPVEKSATTMIGKP